MDNNQSKNYEYKPLQIILYFVLTFLITWSFLIPWARGSRSGDSLALPCAGYGPFLAAVIVIWISKGRTGLRHWLAKIFRLRIPVILYLAGAFVLPLLVGGLEYGLYRVLGGEPDFSTANPWNLYVANLAVVFLLYGGFEEPGWRGFALPALLERLHPTLAALMLGTIHAVWHLPLMSHYGTTIGWFLFNAIPMTIIFNWFYLKSRGSVIPVMLLHAGTNVIGNFIPIPGVVLGGFGTEMFLRGSVYWVMAIVIVILTKGRLGADSNNTQLGD
jgi:membrane protease YdiL (CAAX protease family)